MANKGILLLILLLIVILIVLISVIVILIKVLGKKIYIVVAAVVIIMGIVYCVEQMDYFYYDSNNIVYYLDNGEERITIKAKNHFIEKRAMLKFECKYDINHLKSIIAKQYSNVMFDKDKNEVCIISGNNMFYIFAKKEYSIFGNRYVYSMTEAYVSLHDIKSTSVDDYDVHIPFPYEEIESLGLLIEEKMELKCRFEYLKKYYEHMESARIYDNRIEINSNNVNGKYISITYLGDDIVQFKIEDK